MAQADEGEGGQEEEAVLTDIKVVPEVEVMEVEKKEGIRGCVGLKT